MRTEISHIKLRQQVGTQIRSLRKSKDWSQEVLAEHSGLSYKFIGEIERGTVNPSLDTLLSISSALEVEIATLFSSAPLLILTGKDVIKVNEALSLLSQTLNFK